MIFHDSHQNFSTPGYSCMYLLKHKFAFGKCDRIWENPAYRKNSQAVQCAILVPQLKKCQSRVFVIFISKNLSNLCHHLRRVNISYQGEISLHFDLPSLYGSCTRSPLLWAQIRIFYLDTAGFIKLLYVHSPFSFLGI